MQRNLLLAFFILVKFALGYWIIHPIYELHRDEFLHLDQANHPAFGYLSVPPVTSWIASLIQLLGNGIFWVKFFPILFGVLTLVVVWRAIEALGGNLFALGIGALGIVLSAMLRINMLFQPTSFEILMWTTLYFCILKYIQSGNAKWLFGAAVAFGFGFLNKYNIAFQILGLLPAVLLSPHRTIFARKAFWLAAMLALLIMLPNLYWQFANGFPVIHHMNELKQTQLKNVESGAFIKEQLLFFFGSIYLIVAALVALLVYKPFRPYRLFFWSFVFTLVLFLLLHAKGYYAIGLYPILIAFGSVILEKRLVSKPGVVLRGISIAFTIGFFIAVYKIAYPVDTPEIIKERLALRPDLHLTRWEDGKDHALPQDFADMLGWKELATKTDAALDKLPDLSRTIILCDNYGQAGAINYYSRHKSVRAVTLNADYVNWFPLSQPIRNIVLVQEASDDDPTRNREKAFFKSVQKVGTIENYFAREKGTSVFLLRNATVDINAILRSEIATEKRRWSSR